MTVISILYPILWVYTILRVFLLNTKYCPRTKYDCIVSARSFRSFTGHDFIHLYIQIRWGTLELAAEEAMWTEEAIPEQMIEEHMANLEWEAHLEEEEEERRRHDLTREERARIAHNRAVALQKAQKRRIAKNRAVALQKRRIAKNRAMALHRRNSVRCPPPNQRSRALLILCLSVCVCVHTSRSTSLPAASLAPVRTLTPRCHPSRPSGKRSTKWVGSLAR